MSDIVRPALRLDDFLKSLRAYTKTAFSRALVRRLQALEAQLCELRRSASATVKTGRPDRERRAVRQAFDQLPAEKQREDLKQVFYYIRDVLQYPPSLKGEERPSESTMRRALKGRHPKLK